MSTTDRFLLSDAGLRRLAADVFGQGPLGLDAGMALDEAEAERLVGPFLPDDSEPVVDGYGTYVLCDSGTHLVLDGTPCPTCHHGCEKPGDPACPGRE